MVRARPAWTPVRLRHAARVILTAALAAAHPGRRVREQLRREGRHVWIGGQRLSLSGRLVVVAAGKAASLMARAAEQALGSAVDGGLVVDTSARVPLRRLRLRLAGHPLPDRRGLAAARELEVLVRGLREDDLLLVLLSGGASALLPAPVAGITLADKAEVTRRLQQAGATIHELNVVRKHLSRLKGGGLARLAAPARASCLILSDVVGDDLATIASGPLVPDPSTFDDARRILDQRGLWRAVPASVRRHLVAGCRGAVDETPKPGDAAFARVTTRLVGSNRLSLAGAARAARRLGLRVVRLTSSLEGEAREAGRILAAILREAVLAGHPAAPPVCLLAGGETTVTVHGRGVGGRNQELALGAVPVLARLSVPVLAVALGTDGIDGVSSAAGAIADETSLARASALGLASPAAFLAENDATAFFAALGDLIVTGPTGTNVADVVFFLAGAPAARA